MKLGDWHPLSQDVLDIIVKHQIGAYALSRPSNGVYPEVHYVGRDDIDIHRRLHEHDDDGNYAYCQFAHVPTVKRGYELECRPYHKLQPVDNTHHPAIPDGTSCSCPVMYCSHASP